MVQILSFAGTSSKVNRYNEPIKISFAYTQTIIRLYPNDRAPIRKRSFAYRQIETIFWVVRIIITKHFVSLRQKSSNILNFQSFTVSNKYSII